MYKRIIATTLMAVLLTVGCSNNATPKHLEDPELLGWIFRDCCSYSLCEQIYDRFVEKIQTKQISVPGFESIGTLENALLEVLDYRASSVNGYNDRTALSFDEFMKSYKGSVSDYWDKKISAIIETNPQKAQKLYNALCAAYFAEYERIAKEKIVVLNCCLDVNAQGSKYTGYLIEYEIGEGYYVLLSLIEYDESNRYKADIVYKGNSLQDLQKCYE